MTLINNVIMGSRPSAMERAHRPGRHVAGLVAVCLLVSAGTSGAQQPPREPEPVKVGEAGFYRLEPWPPSLQRVFRLESEAALKERMVREAKKAGKPYEITFPVEPVVSREPFPGRQWEPMAEVIEPAYVCYGRLYFEQINSERYGWDFGCLHPLVSVGIFYFDVLTLPYHAGTDLCRRYECNAGYPLVGEPVPLRLYRPKLSATGALSEAATVALLAVIFP